LRLLRLVPVDAVGELLRHPFPGGGKEPQFVPLDRSAESLPRVTEFLERSDAIRIDVTSDQFRRDVLGRQLRTRIRYRGDARELVAAVLRDHVDLHAAAVAVRADTARFDDDLLDVQLVVDEDPLRRVGQLLVHAVDVRLRLGSAMHAVARLRPVAGAADPAVELLRQRCSRDDV
jgi:hypothetical protein